MARNVQAGVRMVGQLIVFERFAAWFAAHVANKCCKISLTNLVIYAL